MTKKEVQGLIVLFGATGDLASRKLYPALFRLYRRGMLTPNFAVIGTARREWTEDYYQTIVREAIGALDTGDGLAAEFATHFHYVANDATDLQHYAVLKAKMAAYNELYQTGDNYLYYLSTAPGIFPHITKNLKESGIVNEIGHHHVILEKPFGTDLSTATALNDALKISFAENQIYRIDHYLGKEMVQNILATRYYNPIIEKIWHKDYIENIQITLAEDMPVGSRGGYYDQSGAIRDMFQNHILQIAAFIGMELPETLNPRNIQIAKSDFLEAIPSYTVESSAENIVRGQYGPDVNGKIAAFRAEKEVAPDSVTETYIAGKMMVNTERWQGVPFYFRTGKALQAKYSTVQIVLKSNKVDCQTASRLTFYIQPELGLQMSLNGKQFGVGIDERPITLAEDPAARADMYIPEAYEKLFFQIFKGDLTNSTSWVQLQEQWRIVDSIIASWKEIEAPAFPNYAAKSAGPACADDLLSANGHCWINL